MYKRILIPLDNSASDQAILEHIGPLVKMMKSHVILVHVADGFAARLQNQLNLADSDEITKDADYLKQRSAQLQSQGVSVEHHLLSGDPAGEILKFVQSHNFDLIAMSTHGHKYLSDVILGSVANALRHNTDVPILMVRSRPKES